MAAPASYRIVVNGGESSLEVSLAEGDYSPVTDDDMPALVWELARAVSDVEGANTVTVHRTSPVTTAVLEV
ncbi:hypothetical protein [Streptomyces sp. MZ04]|uniref:hypothetical protein n=1 Tax=Streptomyces sp. MZ04 TaxID=2559236 RepID=UPI00107ED3C7|nr:hypothetical protein [Streptomyces sp. MZ04]TGB13836.1 hypothetical protein E2651_07790 [Streptomyces sp. MZ04]